MKDAFSLVWTHVGTILGTGGGFLLFNAWAKHIPDWPISPAKCWEWFKGTAQEVASQRSGPPAVNPPTPPSAATTQK